MGPLNGYTVIELAGIGPAPMGGMILMKIYIRITEVRWITIRSKVENMRTKQVRMSDRRAYFPNQFLPGNPTG